MQTTLHLLIVEDDIQDAELMLTELRREGLKLDWTRVETEADYLANLRPQLDIILCDYSVPGLTALRALELLQDRQPGVPLIIVSGTINEEVAINAMKRGAADYLLKDRLARLGPAVTHAVEQNRFRKERQLAVEQLQLFRMLVDQSDDTFEVIDPQTGRFLDVNEKGCAELGYTLEEYRSLRIFDIDSMMDETNWPQLAETIRTAGILKLETRHSRRDGTTFPVEINAKWVGHDKNYIVAVVRDITERKHALDVVRESERRFREMLENVELIAMTLDKQGRITFCNDHLLKVTGWNREEVIGRSWFSLFIPDSPEVTAMFLETIESGAMPKHYENPIKTRDGDLREIAWNNTLLRGSEGNIIGTASIGEDVTERKRTVDALRQSERRFRSFMEYSPIAGWIVDEEGRFQYVSPGYYRMFAVSSSDLTGSLISEIYEPSIANHYLANNQIALQKQRTVETLESGPRPDGSTGEFVVVKFPMDGPDGTQLLGAVALDITERKKLEQQFFRAQRMESIGTLAGGIAHDLNNSLGPVIMSLDLLRMKFPDSDSQELLDLASTSAQRGADMVRQVLLFGRGLEGRRMEVHLGHLVREIQRIVNDTFLKNIHISTAIPADLWPVAGDPTQLHQVLLNLCLNARDAMPTGGKLKISGENVIFDEQYAALNLDAKPGPYVSLKIEDTGTGISLEHMNKIFDPFFTTKEVGKGTGLGLSSTLAIVKGHGGFIRVESAMGQGTTFHISLPAQTEAMPNEIVPSEATILRGNGELILVVDDEASVREITRQTLEAFGYRVILASDGAEAVSVFASRQGEVNAVLLDMTMPIMDGPTTLLVLKRMNPGLPIIASSGRATKVQLAQIAGMDVKHVLAKPYSAEELLKELKALLAPQG